MEEKAGGGAGVTTPKGFNLSAPGFLVTRLRLVTHCSRGSASFSDHALAAFALLAIFVQAEPARQCVTRRSLVTRVIRCNPCGVKFHPLHDPGYAARTLG